jgi:uncharacterized protein with ParB-like and HNH nuclease domain
MGSAANNIEAKSKSLRDLLKQRRYKVGYFQREYRWKRYNIEDLIIDLERSFFENYDSNHTQKNVAKYDCYYMGPIVLFQEDSEYSIVDGQQRLSAFTLLIIYLKHKFSEILNQDSSLDEYIYSDYFGDVSYNLNIKERLNIIEKLFKNKEIDPSDLINESSRNLFDSFQSIIEMFPKRLLIPEVLPLFTNWITERLIFIEIMAQSNDSAYTIFETMNDRGLNLTPTEMLKSYLLSKVEDEEKIKELDIIWKQKVGLLKSYSNEEDMVFFRAWLKGKHAITIRIAEKDAQNEDFEKISTRFHNWVQDNSKKLLLLHKPDDYYFFVQSDFQFFSDLYIKLIELEHSENLPEHNFKFMTLKGISSSLSYPFIFSSIQKIDDSDMIKNKINLSVNYLDALGIYKLLLNEPITHSSIRVNIYNKVKDIRNNELKDLNKKLKLEIDTLRGRFLHETDYINFDTGYAKYLLARMFKRENTDIPFEDIYFQRKKESFVLYQFFTFNNVESIVHKIPAGLKDIFINSLVSYCVVPRKLVLELEKMHISERIKILIKENYILEFKNSEKIPLENLREFFIERNKKMKELIYNFWKL